MTTKVPPRPSRPTFRPSEEESVLPRDDEPTESTLTPTAERTPRREPNRFAWGMVVGSVLATVSFTLGAFVGLVAVAMGSA